MLVACKMLSVTLSFQTYFKCSIVIYIKTKNKSAVGIMHIECTNKINDAL